VAVAASRATTTGLPSFRTPILQQPYFSYASGATPAGADGARVRYSPQAWYYGGPFGGWFDYVQTDGPVRRGDVRTHIAHRAWQAAGSWVLTGEAATDSAAGVRPRNDFDFRRGHWGAFQIAARYHVLEIDPDAIALGLASPGASRKAEAWTVGLRWYISGHCWYTFNFERAVFDDNPNGPRPPEHAVALRTQLGF
jgi:phosphate-selective porin OprO/OprP